MSQVLVRWVHPDAPLANGLTKARELKQLLLYYSTGQHWKIVEDPTMSSARKREEKGQQPLEDASHTTPSSEVDKVTSVKNQGNKHWEHEVCLDTGE